ncbi:glia-derived nexin [Choloepus didactylus]|uniref:glia-derived nexin n=1 Tax=Choloepus didactylus TaxID=27675 RepID=UPI0018A0ED38|nr:glia-derived nexin [Choloepus didactylus]XP_037704883.1 glia-derived nexin [Choloepus didactylus]XP_037704884.1 glia-derived nexin [Choloepus didactylus]
MNWHFPFLLLATVTLPLVSSRFNSLSLEELGSDIGIQVFNQIIKSRPHENIVVSPHGISSILGMLQLGADGRTKKQLTTVMRYSVNGVGKVLKKINKAIVSKKNKDTVAVASAMFVKNGFKMEVPFVTRNKDVFQCEVRNVDFEDPASACEAINLWVKNETRGMIDNLLSPDLIDGVFTRLILVNAVYFKGLWKSRFQPENTKKRTFVAADGKSYQVPMLAQLSVFRCGSTSTPNDIWYNFIELPYHGESISMLIALPTESATPLSAIIPHISTKTIDSWMSIMVPKRVQVILPKFTAVAQTDLKEPLKVLGITEMFDPSKANFAKITRSENIHISHILQKAKIEVSEDGTKASAATTAILIARSSPPWFMVDRPFIFFIRHNPTGSILFMGQINKP